MTSWRRMTSRFRHGLGTAGPPRPLQADTPVTWVTKVTTQLVTEPRMGGFLNERIEASFCVAQRSAAEENGVSMLREGGHRPRDARAFLSVCGLTVTSQKATTKPITTHTKKDARRSLDSGHLTALRESDRGRPEARTRDHGGLQKQTPTHHTPSVFCFL